MFFTFRSALLLQKCVSCYGRTRLLRQCSALKLRNNYSNKLLKMAQPSLSENGEREKTEESRRRLWGFFSVTWKGKVLVLRLNASHYAKVREGFHPKCNAFQQALLSFSRK